jgi:hypothetical protein
MAKLRRNSCREMWGKTEEAEQGEESGDVLYLPSAGEGELTRKSNEIGCWDRD